MSWFNKKPTAKVTWQYTMLPMLPDSDQTNVNPVDYLVLMNSLGESGFELCAIHENVLIFKKLCYVQEK